MDVAPQRAEPHHLISPAAITRQAGDSASHGTLANIYSVSLATKKYPGVTTFPLPNPGCLEV